MPSSFIEGILMSSTILQRLPLGAPPWPTLDPFLFCVHHNDAYPAGNGSFGPAASLAGRNIGQDFSGKDGWSMYHGEQVPGFPGHPHRGFETVTIVRQGLIDHSDSLGAAARFGEGDVQWLTAGQGIVHSEMFPLLRTHAPNPAELFQIWLNLPARHKMAAPHFTMFWSPEIPRLEADGVQLSVIAGPVPQAAAPLAPPPASWASQPEGEVAIWTLKLAPGARFTLPVAQGAGVRRMLYFFQGNTLSVNGETVHGRAALELRTDVPTELVNGDQAADMLVLQGRPIAEPVAQYGPFVMNTQAEIQQAFNDYRRTQFGGWPWPNEAPVHGQLAERFARHPDGRVEKPTGAAFSPIR
jgi:quercetin 2,3-dioxygenase